ncbi:MAG TPA: hypothetical protein VGC59_11490 [Solirubrobacteraceae bacterium]
MSRSAAATTAGRQRSVPRSPAPRHPRRVSGPARAQVSASGAVAYPRPQRLPARPPLRVVAGGAAIASRVAGVALDVSGSRAMDRLVRSRGWIVIVAFGLIGIVAMQVSMLKLNAGIGRAVETVSTLERSNALLRGDLSRLSDGSRIQTLAGARGYVMPSPADVTYLRAGDLRADGARAARRMIAPDFALAGPAGAATVSPAAALAPPAAPTTAAAAAPTAPAAAPSQTTLPAAAPPAAPPASVTPAPTGGVAPAAAAPAASQPPAATPSAGGAAPATAPQAVGGVGGP